MEMGRKMRSEKPTRFLRVTRHCRSSKAAAGNANLLGQLGGGMDRWSGAGGLLLAGETTGRGSGKGGCWASPCSAGWGNVSMADGGLVVKGAAPVD